MSDSGGAPRLQAALVPDLFLGGVRVLLRLRTDGGVNYGRIDDRGFLGWQAAPDPAAAITAVNQPAATLALDDDAARVLLDVLAEHYGGASVSRAARADFEREAGRVDWLIGTLVDVARGAVLGDGQQVRSRQSAVDEVLTRQYIADARRRLDEQ